MRILVITPTGDKMGHSGIYTVKLCQALGKMGHSVVVCTNRIHPERYIEEPPAFAVAQVCGGAHSFERFDQAANSRPSYYYWGYFRNSYLIVREAIKLCRSSDFDVIYLTDAEFLIASLLLRAYRKRIPPVVMEVSAANFSFYDYPGSILKKIYKVFQREVFRRTLGSEIYALSVRGEWHKGRLRLQLRPPSGFPIMDIPDGGGDPPARMSQVDARRKLGIDYTGSILLFFGMLRRDKGIENFFRAIALIRDQEFKVVITGYPIEYTPEEIVRLAREAGVMEQLILRLEYVADSDVPLYFFGCDALVLPYVSAYRGGSGPLLKGACTHGRPVIVSDVSEMGRLVKEHAIGLTSMPDDPASLAARMREFLLMSRASRDQMGERASALAKTNSWEVMAKKFTGLFEEVCGRAHVRH